MADYETIYLAAQPPVPEPEPEPDIVHLQVRVELGGPDNVVEWDASDNDGLPQFASFDVWVEPFDMLDPESLAPRYRVTEIRHVLGE